MFGGDTYPNKWYAEYAKDADLAIHECFITVPDMITKFQFTPAKRSRGRDPDPYRTGSVRQDDVDHQAANGRGLSLLQRFRYVDGVDLRTGSENIQRPAESGPGTTWCGTSRRTRFEFGWRSVDEDVWPPPATEKPQLPDPSQRIPYSAMIAGGKIRHEGRDPADV